MEHNESNFFYLKKTSLSKYYDELLKAECLCEKFPRVTKTIVRKVIEAFLKDIAEERSIETHVPAWKLFNSIKLSSSIFFTEDIYNYIETILINGYENPSHNNESQIRSKEPIEVLEIMHNVLCWYLNKRESEVVKSFDNLRFMAPYTMDYMEKQVIKIKDDILLKNKQINNLRQKIIELADQGKNISEINNIIIAIKDEKSQLENVQVALSKRIEIQKKHELQMEKDNKIYIKKCDDLKELCIENEELFYEKESQLVNVEIQNQELKNLIKELEYEDESIKKMELHLDEELKILRQAYENLLNLTTEYQDILETVEFSYDKELQKILGAKKNNIKIKMNFEDGVFSENIIEYVKNISEVKRKVVIFKEIVNERIKRRIKYGVFYGGFLGLKGRNLKIIYTTINMTANLLNKQKEFFLKSNEDKILEAISSSLVELKSVNDDEIKLVLYYKLMRLSKISIGSIRRKKQFIGNLDELVDEAYDILISKKDFKVRIKKLDAIIAYYLEKFILAFKSKGNNQFINEELVKKIYNKIFALNQKAENVGKIYNEKFDFNTLSEMELKTNIKSHLSTFLLILVDLGDINSYKEISSIIFEAFNAISKRLSSHEEKVVTTEVSVEDFIIQLFISNETTFSIEKKQRELLPLLIMIIIIVSLFSNDEDNLENYDNILALWRKKQQNYENILIGKEEQNEKLRELIKERKELEIQYENWIRTHEILVENYRKYKDEFKKIILNSDKKIFLPSYERYYELCEQKEKAEENINKSKDRLGTLKSMVSPSVWKDQASKFINESNMEDVERQLLEEAKQKAYFKSEYSVFLDLEVKIKRTNELIEESKRNIQYKESLINEIKIKINGLESKLNAIKETYVDIEDM